jgi:pseudaminic acid synthase
MNNNQIILLKCTSEYPAKIEDANLLTIRDLGTRFNVIPGISDHTPGYIVPVTSIALGAKVIEKHFIIDRSLGGPDASFSMNPEEFKQMVENVRNAEKAMGKVDYELTPQKLKSRQFSRSLFAVKDISQGEIFTEDNVRSIRPGFGLHPKFLRTLLGKKATCQITRGTPITVDMICNRK